MKIIYIHHGQRNIQNSPNKDDDLTELGYKDCELQSEIFKNKANKITAIYSATLHRCLMTAKILNKTLNTQIIEDERLNEFKSFKNETWIEAQERIMSLLDEIIQNHNDDDAIVCVTSGVNIGAFICKAFNIKPSENTPFLGVPSCSPIIFEFKK